MIETVVIAFLGSALDVPVYAEIPEEDVAEFVVVQKTGSSEENYINSATLAIQSYAATLYDAASLNERVKTAMRALRVENSVSAVRLNSDYLFNNTQLKQYRYQAVFDVIY